jgi:erythritol transport system ATP-binding protein
VLGVTASDPKVILEARAVTKRYPGTLALDAVTYRAHRGCVNVLIGENGAGKSTLMRLLAGVETPDEGDLFLEEEKITLPSPRAAAQRGIAIVHQELSILPNLTLAENIFAGRELVRSGLFVDGAVQEKRSREALHQLQKPMAVATQAGHLSLGSRQIVEVARTLDQRAKILILDEPTSALSNPEAESLFKVIEELKRSGVTILYISHRLNELLHLGDHFTVLRSGRVVGEAPRSEVTRQWIIQRMSGRDIASGSAAPTVEPEGGPFLEVEGLTLAGGSDTAAEQVRVRGIRFALKKGEILGIYGLLGAGRSELLEALAGFRPLASGEIRLIGKPLRIRSVRDAMRAGIHLVPEDRQRDGLIPELSIRENIALAASRSILLSRTQEADRVRLLIAELKIRASDLEMQVSALSGGNQQKVLIARCLMRSPSVLLLDEPTRGVDIGAKAEIHEILRRLAKKGVGVIFASSEIEETQALADRGLVLCQGQVAAQLERAQLSDDALFAAASPLVAASPALPSGDVPA